MTTPNDLQERITSAFFSLRIGSVAASVVLPFALYFGGVIKGTVPKLQPSISDYYWAGDALLRDWFVGTLCAVGVFLYAYRGFSTRENVALNFAGAFAVLTALNPCVCGDPARSPSIHGTSAVLFYLTMAFVCIVCAPETLEMSDDEAFKKRFRAYYKAIGVALLLSPVGAVVASFALRAGNQVKFFVETFGLAVFAAYWFVKTREMSITQAEKEAAAGRAVRVKGRGVMRAAA
jgi:hypothetical protein